MSSHVQKLRVAARLSQPNLDPRDGWFLLYPRVEPHGRAETVLELLNSTRSVIPFVLKDDSSVLLLMRHNIDWIVMGSGVASSLVFPPDRVLTHRQPVELRFVDERTVEAVISWGSDAGPMRLSDFLDSADSFVSAETGFGTLIVNKQRLREIRILDSKDRASTSA